MSTGTGRGKQKVVAGILGILLGSLGVHHFYLGSIGAGVVCLVLSVCTLGLGGLLGFVEGILLLVMPDADFDAKYNARSPESMEFVFMKK
jgi:TM2 domain-containing membrane protein YozV